MTIRKRGAEVEAGDILKVNDWKLHVRKVDHENATAVVVAEFNFILHLDNDRVYTVEVDDESD